MYNISFDTKKSFPNHSEKASKKDFWRFLSILLLLKSPKYHL